MLKTISAAAVTMVAAAAGAAGGGTFVAARFHATVTCEVPAAQVIMPPAPVAIPLPPPKTLQPLNRPAPTTGWPSYN